MKFLETPRLLVRHFVPADANALFRVHSNPKVAQYMGDGKPLTYERCVKWIETSMQNYQTRGFGASAVVEKNTGELVGCWCDSLSVNHGNQSVNNLTTPASDEVKE